MKKLWQQWKKLLQKRMKPHTKIQQDGTKPNENQKSISDCFKSGSMSVKYETTQDTTQQRCQAALDTQTIPFLKSRWRHWWLPLCLDTELSDLIFCFVQYHEAADKCLFLVFPGDISCYIIILAFVLLGLNSNYIFEFLFTVSTKWLQLIPWLSATLPPVSILSLSVLTTNIQA